MGWTDEGAGGVAGYAYQVSADGVATRSAGATSRPDGEPRLFQEISTVTRDGVREPVDVEAHTYCVVIRRLSTTGVADSLPSCTGTPRGAGTAP